ncbi:hypothetical protein [Pseudonocardia nigra]|uniref:hypothetical protein n=1 Tax=Pseudonocardia nigra TaxID=1921578 RepID=UPI001C60462A|nr:hypothetical protein [Pseudonocardia nigra]
MNRSRPVVPVIAAAAAAAITVLALVLVGGATGVIPPSGEPPPGAALTDEDRRALDAVPVERGAPPAPVDPGVDLTDPEAVARAYLAVAHSVGVEDAGRTHLRAAGYAVPGSPPATVGVVVLDPPPAGSLRTATVTALELVAAEAGDRRRGYRAELGTATGPPGAAAEVTLVGRDVVLARMPDGRWLVAADSPATADLPAGED